MQQESVLIMKKLFLLSSILFFNNSFLGMDWQEEETKKTPLAKIALKNQLVLPNGEGIAPFYNPIQQKINLFFLNQDGQIYLQSVFPIKNYLPFEIENPRFLGIANVNNFIVTALLATYIQSNDTFFCLKSVALDAQSTQVDSGTFLLSATQNCQGFHSLAAFHYKYMKVKLFLDEDQQLIATMHTKNRETKELYQEQTPLGIFLK